MIHTPKVGSILKVTTRYPETYIFSKDKFQYHVTSGQVVENDRLTPVGSFSITTGRREYPVAIIALRNVWKIEEAGKTLKASIKKNAPKTWKVKSSKGNETYTVTNNAGLWTCTCVGFQFHRRCKHILSKKGK